MRDLRQYLDLRQEHLDFEGFASALTLRHIRMLVSYGGCEHSLSDFENALHPAHIEKFLKQAITTAQRTGYFLQEWHLLLHNIPLLQTAWERGQSSFQEDLLRIRESREEQEYFEQIDFVINCYAYAIAQQIYPKNRVLQSWLTHGYLLAWRTLFVSEEENHSF